MAQAGIRVAAPADLMQAPSAGASLAPGPAPVADLQLLAPPPALTALRCSGSPEPAPSGFRSTSSSSSASATRSPGAPLDPADECHRPFAAQVASEIRRAESSHSSVGQVRQESVATPLIQPPHANAKLQPGILHVGTGHFSLSHLASYVDDVLASGDTRWGVVAVSLRSGAILRELSASHGRHLLLERKEGKQTKARMVRAVHSTVAPASAPTEVPRWMCDERIRLVTLTVTLAGYYFRGPEQELNLDAPDIQHDLVDPATPKTIYGLLAAGLRQRRTALPDDKGRLVILPLDNVEHCGARFQTALRVFLVAAASPSHDFSNGGGALLAAESDVHALLSWVDSHVDVLNSMVDRITPNCEPALADTFRERWGVDPHTPVVITEQYKELVHTRSRFSAQCLPPWDRVAGVKVVDTCDSDWRRKGYLLNGMHHACAVLAKRIGGLQWVHEAIQHPSVSAMLTALQDEVCFFLCACGEDFRAAQRYARTTQERFLNSACPDAIDRIGAQSTRKTSQRVLGAILDTHARLGVVPRALTMLVAMWMINIMQPAENPSSHDAGDSNGTADGSKALPTATGSGSGSGSDGSSALPVPPADSDSQLFPTLVSSWQVATGETITEDSVRAMLVTIEENSAFPLFLAAAQVGPFVTELTQSLRKLKLRGAAACISDLCGSVALPPSDGDVHVHLPPPSSASPPPAPVTHLLLDCDGTLVDSEGLAFRTSVLLVNSWLQGRGVDAHYTAEQLMSEFVGSSFNKIIGLLVHKHNLAPLTEEEMRDLVAQEDERVTAVLTAEVKQCEGVLDALLPVQKAGRLHLAVVTSSSQPRVHASLVASGLYDQLGSPLIYSAVSSLPQPRSKPDPSVYLRAMLEQRAHPTRCVAVEDSVSGTTSAKRAGCIVLAYTGTQPPEERAAHAEKLRKAGASECIQHWSEFPALMRKCGWGQ